MKKREFEKYIMDLSFSIRKLRRTGKSLLWLLQELIGGATRALHKEIRALAKFPDF